MGMIPDLEQEQERAVAALKAAERAMLEHSNDPAAFQQAEQVLAAAQAEVRRLEWAAKHAAEQVAREARDKRRAELVEAQARAKRARDDSAAVAAELSELVLKFESLISMLQSERHEIERGLRYEAFGLKDGLIDRSEIQSGLHTEGDVAVRALRAAKELVKLSPVSLDLAEIRARQRSA